MCKARALPPGYNLNCFLRAFFLLVPIIIFKLPMSSTVSLRYTGKKKNLRTHCNVVHGAQEYIVIMGFWFVCFCCLVSLVGFTYRVFNYSQHFKKFLRPERWHRGKKHFAAKSDDLGVALREWDLQGGSREWTPLSFSDCHTNAMVHEFSHTKLIHKCKKMQ